MSITLQRPAPAARRLRIRVPGGPVAIVLGLTALAAALRFPTLATQSFWHDEAVTAGRIIQPGLGRTLHEVRISEAAPPVYYVLAWVWTRVLGVSEAGLRSLSALAGVALVPVAYAAAARLVRPSAGIVAAALVACSPLLVWYSQEARVYSLLTLLAGLSVLCFARARSRPSRRRLAEWAVVSSVALATHYFAVFLVAAEAVWLLSGRMRRARVAVAVTAVAATGVALLPLALQQMDQRHDAWIARLAFGGRLTDTAKAFAFGPSGEPSVAIYAIGGALLVAAAVLFVTRAAPGERLRIRVPLALGAAALGMPLVLAALGVDFFFFRNLVPAFVPLLIAVAGALTLGRVRRAGTAIAVALCAIGIGTVVLVDSSPALQRPDWRGAAAVIGPARAPRALVVPFLGDDPLEYYLPNTTRLHGAARVGEVDVLGWSAAARPRPPAPGFRQVARRRVGRFTLIRFAGPARLLHRVALTRARLDPGHAAVLLEAPR